jgi:hypothetical protein
VVKKLFIGDVNFELAEFAKTKEKDSILITDDNFSTEVDYAYTSIGDLCLTNFISILFNSLEIFYLPPQHWSDGKTSETPYSLGWLTKHYLRLVKNQKNIPVHGIDFSTPEYVHQPIARKTEQPQIWVIGCSTSKGSGVTSDEVYGQILSKKLKMPVTILAQSGSSNLFQSQLLCQAEIKKDDIVIFGLTTKSRLKYIINGELLNVSASEYLLNPKINEVLPLEYFDQEQRTFESIYAIQMAQNFCNQTKAKLILIGIHVDLDVSSLISYNKNYIMVHGTTGLDWDSSFLDFGSDGEHPGPLTHQYYAKLILDKLFSLNYINKEKNTLPQKNLAKSGVV